MRAFRLFAAAEQLPPPRPQLTAAHAAAPVNVGVASPFVDQSALSNVVWTDLGIPAASMPLTRDVLMSIPALARQRHLLCGTGAKCPLVAMTGDARSAVQPRWMTRTDGKVHPYHRMLWTIDDLLFDGWSLWSVTRAADDSLETADRVNPARWTIDDYLGELLVDGEPVDESRVILIPGPHEGIASFGADALRRTLDNLEAAATAARNPSAYLELHYTGDADLTDEEIDAHVARWAAARKGVNGGVAWTNKLIELKEHGTHESHLLIEGRNADAVDVSRLVSSPAAMADATNAGASLTYETTDGRNGQFLDYGASFYMDAIAARLSMDDCVPAGERTAFDVTQLRQLGAPTTGAPTSD